MKKHIEIKHLQDCCGCTACKNICPKQCISMQTDYLGFQYPYVNVSLCIECGMCRQVCPFLNPKKSLSAKKSYAATNSVDEERIKSSSGGVFINLSKRVIAEHGVVFGAVFDENWNVKHVAAQSLYEVSKMMGSKYVQSKMDNCYSQAKSFLNAGKLVLFSGTPCEIAGLKHYLKKDYDNLICVEVICHGVPAPLSWYKNIREAKKSINRKDTANYRLDSVSFRDKRKGWRNFGLCYSFAGPDKADSKIEVFESFHQNRFMQAFLNNWSLRPSCYNCKAKNGHSHADLTIGDFWGIENIRTINDDDKGISCIICRTEKGQTIFNSTHGLEITAVSYDSILRGNSSIENSVENTPYATAMKTLIKFLGLGQTMAMMKIYHNIIRAINFVNRRSKQL